MSPSQCFYLLSLLSSILFSLFSVDVGTFICKMSPTVISLKKPPLY